MTETETQTRPSPERILQLATGTWAAAILGAAATHSVVEHVEGGADTAETLARQSGISTRGAQTLLDGLVGLGLLELRDGMYVTTPDSSAYLVAGRPGYLGGFARVLLSEAASWSTFPEVVRTGTPAAAEAHEAADDPFWEQLVPALAPLTAPVAAIAAEHLQLADLGPVSVLDVGGGSGVYSAVWLGINPAARSTQLDWAPVNAIARRLVAEHGVGDRFSCIDGDLHGTEFGTAAYDLAIYSHVAHMNGPQQNIEVLRRLRRALKPGGTLAVSELVVDEDRSGPPFPLVFASAMLLQSSKGTTWRASDLRSWLAEAGFEDVTVVPTPTPSTLVFAR